MTTNVGAGKMWAVCTGKGSLAYKGERNTKAKASKGNGGEKTKLNYCFSATVNHLSRPRRSAAPSQSPTDLLARDGAGDNLGIEMVRELRVQAALHRKRLVHKLFVKVLFRIVHENDSHALVVKLRAAWRKEKEKKKERKEERKKGKKNGARLSRRDGAGRLARDATLPTLRTGSARHLQHVGNVKVDVALQLAVKVLGALDNDKVRRQIDAPRQGGRGDKHLNLVVQEQLLDNLDSAILERRRRRIRGDRLAAGGAG